MSKNNICASCPYFYITYSCNGTDYKLRAKCLKIGKCIMLSRNLTELNNDYHIHKYSMRKFCKIGGLL